MKKTIIVTLAILAMATTAMADEYVNGYTRQDGTYVQPHYRSSPNSTTQDNYSTKGNVNPYTGQQGTQPAYPNQPNYGSPYGNYGR